MHNGVATPVFGLTKEQLWPIVEGAAGEPVMSFEISVEHEVVGHYGYAADKLVPTFSYTALSGRTGRCPVFAKRFHREGSCEADHYAVLAECQAPIPRMYGSLSSPNGREIIFLEYLEPIGDLYPFQRFLSEAGRFEQFLAVAAHLNSVRLPARDAARLPGVEPVRRLIKAVSELAITWHLGREGKLGDNLKTLCTGDQEGLLKLQALARELTEPVGQMPRGLCHNDFYPDSTAWRRQPRELVAVDLESLGFAPRFLDVARWLGAPEEVQPRPCPLDQLVGHYAGEYARRSGHAVSAGQLVEEARQLWTAHSLSFHWWWRERALDGEVDWTDDVGEGRRVCRDALCTELQALLDRI